MLKKFVQIFGGDPNKREIDKYSEHVDRINLLETSYEALSDEELRAKTDEFRRRLGKNEPLESLLIEAFTVVREACKRTLGIRHFDVQLIGGVALHSGKITEMRTGEGKTLVATLPLYLNALRLNSDWINLAQRRFGTNPDNWVFEPLDGIPVGRGTHLITVNDYLARRDARWMAPIYLALGMGVGVLQMAARTENGKKAFIVDLTRESPHEDQHHLLMVPRQDAYAADITYGTNSEYGFDYLRDNMTSRLEDRVQRGHHFAIIDEVDNVLIDEARTPLIISGPAQDEAEWYIHMSQIVRGLRPEDYEISEKDRTVYLTEIGETRVEEALGAPLRDPNRPEDILPEQARTLGYLEQALRAQFLFRRNKEYLVQAGKVIIIDEFTGRLMPGRRWSDGLHQAVEAKEGVKVQSESVTYATITIQNYFRMYEKLSGMTGTAITEAEEFDKIYKLGVLAIPTNLEYQAMNSDSGLVQLEARDEQGYKYQYYTHKNDQQLTPVFWKRKDYPDVVYRTEEAKLRAITFEILQYHVLGRPVLVGTTSVELSDRVSSCLRAEPLRRLCQVKLLRSYWMEKNNKEDDGRIISDLQFMNQPLDQLDISAMRRMARDLDVSFNPEDPSNLGRLLSILQLKSGQESRLIADLQGGIPHEVLNARKHTEESQIITGAGAFGAVTIATNMAGRGVDIKLGGELAEEIFTSVHRVLHKSGYDNSYDMQMQEIREALQKLDPDDYGIYGSEVTFFLQHMEDMERVRDLGGLHVIGSERHEARRIDNQLRGRSARQGDPGSSKFYLSMEDELMRLFGGQQADGLMQRLKIDDDMPLEVGLVGRLVEQSQTRVEGANFDIRKHLLEYDDVLNTQRAKIYAQRNRIFTKHDLSKDLSEMLRVEVSRRVPEALDDEGGPWKLLSWLDQIQTPMLVNGQVVSSYTLQLLADSIMQGKDTISKGDTLTSLVEIIKKSIHAEKEHLIQAVNTLLDQTQDRLDQQIAERMDTINTYFDALGMDSEFETQQRPSDIIAEISNLVHLPIKLSNESIRALRTQPRIAEDEVRIQVESALINQAITRLVGSIERRLDEALELSTAQLSTGDWNVMADKILEALDKVFSNRLNRYVGDGTNGNGQVTKELESTLERISGSINQNLILGLLLQIPQGARASFDKKTHRRVWQQTTRIVYSYFAAHFIDDQSPNSVTEDVLAHLERIEEKYYHLWGQFEWSRLANGSLAELDETTRHTIVETYGQDYLSQIEAIPLTELPPEDRVRLVEIFGRHSLTQIYRQLLLNVITELWVDYLTQMEGLRVSIGLEAYAQRDPLVQYKNQAFSLFQELLSNMRLAVVSRMFTYRPREVSIQQPTSLRPGSTVDTGDIIQDSIVASTQADEKIDEEQEVVLIPGQSPSNDNETDSQKKKRKRRRR